MFKWFPGVPAGPGERREVEGESKLLLTPNAGRGLVVLALLGAALILLSRMGEPEQPVGGTLDHDDAPPTPAPSRDDARVQQLRSILAQISGAGVVDVFISMDSGPELTVAEEVTSQHTVKDDEQPGVTSSDARETRRPVTLRDDAARVERPLVLTQKEPRVRGVVVVADGADSAQVRYKLTKAVQVALGVPAHRVEVFARRPLR